MRNIKTILFDFDGTLYQDTTYVTIFLQDLLKDTKHASYLETITTEAQKILSGNHGVKLGQFVDLKDYVFQGYEPLLYRSSIEIKNYEEFDDQYHYVGDGWQICFLIAHVLKISKEQVQTSFLRIRLRMAEPAYGLSYNKQLPGLLTLCRQAGLRVLLVTNTVKEGAQYFLKLMKLEDSFDDIVYDAGKPKHSHEFIKRLKLDPTSLLAIGDVPYNDLYPILQAGGYTVLLSEFDLKDAHFYHKQMKTFDQLNHLLCELIDHKGVLYEETDRMEC